MLPRLSLAAVILGVLIGGPHVGRSLQLNSQNQVTAPPPPCGVQCGEERWHVKTLTDQDAGKVNFTPVVKSLVDLVSLSAPATNSENSRLNDIEKTTFTVRARLAGYKLETDGDFHIVVTDVQDPSTTMVVEIPNPDCAVVCISPKLQEIQQVRQKFARAFPNDPPVPDFAIVQGNVEVDVTGVGFFDFAHGQVGLARNCIELHPVLDINFTQAGPFEAKKETSGNAAARTYSRYNCIPRSSSPSQAVKRTKRPT
jgi:hypothetical protein